MEDERLEDPAFVERLTSANKRQITRIRTLAIACGFQFDESHLGEGNEVYTSVIFERPEGVYCIEAITDSGKPSVLQVYPRSTEFLLNDIDYRTGQDKPSQMKIKDIEAAKEAFRQGGLAAALAMEPDPALQNDLKSYVSTLLDTPEVDRVLEAAIKGDNIDMQFECGALICRIWKQAYRKSMIFSRPR